MYPVDGNHEIEVPVVVEVGERRSGPRTGDLLRELHRLEARATVEQYRRRSALRPPEYEVEEPVVVQVSEAHLGAAADLGEAPGDTGVGEGSDPRIEI